ncbi:MAG TPA: type IV pilus secretin PilQ [Myxococcota bacterium]|nr:type IV pilus secretin PilQ [Myxococcota bacterium]
MRGFKTLGFQVAIGAALCGSIAVGTFACAGSGAPPSASSTASSEVVDVLAESNDGGTTITVVGPVSPVYNAHHESDPDRVVVDLANVKPGEIADAIPINDGRVSDVRVTALDEREGQTITRVEIGLAAPSVEHVTAGPEGVVIALTPGDATATARDPWTARQADEAAQGDDAETGAWTGEPAEGELGDEAHPATVLSGVDARAVGAGSIIHLRGDGTVGNAATFTLEDPARLVIDLPAIKNKVAKKTIEVGSPQVARVRVGSHDDKVRVVVDGGTDKAPFEGRRVLPVASGLIIALGADPALDAAVASASGTAPAHAQHVAETAPAKAAPAPAKAAPAPGGPVKIYGVEFDAQPERDRVVVLSESPIDYLVYEPDPETLILSIAGATIAPEAAVRIAPEKVGAVSLVTAFAQPDVKRPEVRVVVKRAAGLKPEVSRHDAVLTMDFPNNGKVAAVPPVYAERGAAPAGGAAQAAPGAAGTRAAASPAEPASGTPPASIDILNEGGLMDGKEYVGRHISLDFKGVDIADVLRLIAEVSDLNVIAGDEVKGKVTIRLVDEPWDQALDVILLTKGLGFARVGNVLRIAAKDTLAQEEELRLQERRAKEKLEDLVVKLQPVNYASVQDVSGMVKELLTERGTVNVDKRTNTLIIKDIPSVIDEATALIKAVDAMTPQVMIEAKIVEASLQYSRELGTKWSFGTNPITESTLGGRDYVFTQGPSDQTAGSVASFGNPITSSPTGVLGLAATVLDQKFNYDVELQAAEVNGEGKVISSPRVVTLDNGPAIIEQGVSIPFQTFENGDAQLEFVDAVLKLDVTPHITADGSIIMKIKVSRNAPDDSVATLDGTPGIAKNQVQTETLVKDGQTLVLGGIYVVDRAEHGTAVPFMSKLPFLGALFRSNEVGDNRKELLVFVSPRVVETQVPAAS